MTLFSAYLSVIFPKNEAILAYIHMWICQTRPNKFLILSHLHGFKFQKDLHQTFEIAQWQQVIGNCQVHYLDTSEIGHFVSGMLQRFLLTEFEP